MPFSPRIRNWLKRGSPNWLKSFAHTCERNLICALRSIRHRPHPKNLDGRVYLNPPYGQTIDAWIERLVDGHAAGTVTEAITLLPARTDTRWFRRLEPFPRCFIYGRPIFANASGPAPFPSAIVYLGPNVERFYRSFASLGGIFVSVSYAPRGEVA